MDKLKIIGSTQCRQNLSEHLNDIEFKSKSYIIERYNRLSAALVPIEDYKLIQKLKGNNDELKRS